MDSEINKMCQQKITTVMLGKAKGDLHCRYSGGPCEAAKETAIKHEGLNRRSILLEFAHYPDQRQRFEKASALALR
jgi:hypothetical protein